MMAIIDVFDRGVSLLFAEFRALPPNRFRLRVGVGNRILFNQSYFIKYGYQTWFSLLNEFITFSDDIVDIGSGCGRTAYAVRDNVTFTGHYTGIDVDLEMISWCCKHFPPERFAFVHANIFNSLYNPSGSRGPYHLPLDNESVDLSFSQSLFTHLLEEDLTNYVAESYRVLRNGKAMVMSVFCIEDMQNASLLSGRWTFANRVKNAFVENLRYPEAAVGYTRDFLITTAREAGFADCEVRPGAPQSLLVARKRG